MDELSPEHKAFLELAKRRHEVPDPALQVRVEQAVARRLASDAMPLATPLANDARGGRAWLGRLGRRWLPISAGSAGALALVIAGSVWLQRAAPAASAPKAVAVSALPPPSATAVPLPSVTQPAQAVLKPLRPEPTPHGASLEDDVQSLQQASIAIARGELVRARQLLARHRRERGRGSLAAEWAGLEVLLQCAEAPAHGRRAAEAFLTRSPGDVLSARIRRACGLDAP